MHIVQMLIALILPASLLALVLRHARSPALLPSSNAATRHQSRRGRQQGGFTLIELLIVLVILAVIVALVVGVVVLMMMTSTHVH